MLLPFTICDNCSGSFTEEMLRIEITLCNKNIKRQLDNYLSKKDKIYTRYKIDEANKRVSQLDKEYSKVFQNPLVENYFKSTQNFNLLMQSVYKSIEQELLR